MVKIFVGIAVAAVAVAIIAISVAMHNVISWIMDDIGCTDNNN